MKLTDRIIIYDRKKIADSRGWFLKIITGKEEYLPSFTGEVYIISAHSNESRANHYHNEAHEWFSIAQGKIEMVIEDIDTKERLIIKLDAAEPKTVYVPNFIAHSFNNVGDEPYILVTYTNKLYVPEDTIPYEFNI